MLFSYLKEFVVVLQDFMLVETYVLLAHHCVLHVVQAQLAQDALAMQI